MSLVDRNRLEWSPALDGLRGLAVLIVMLFHFKLTKPWLPGGFVGVDVFFVLSGFLITALLVREWDGSGTISLRHFYARRALRLLPALLLFLGTYLGIALALPDLAGRPSLSLCLRNVLWTLGYAYNWYVAWLQPFPGGFHHVWSLSVEEQFYLVWPALLLWLSGRGLRRRELIGVILCLILASVAVPHVLRAGSWKRIYFGSDVRAQELLIGALLGLLWVRGMLPARLCTTRGFRLGLAVSVTLLAGVALFGDIRAGWLGAAFPLLALGAGCVVLACVLRPAGVPARLLSTRALVYVGSRSYALYLWHDAFNFWLRDLAPVPHTTLAFGLSFAAAELSYRAVELPALRLKARLSRNVPRADAPAEQVALAGPAPSSAS